MTNRKAINSSFEEAHTLFPYINLTINDESEIFTLENINIMLFQL